MRKTSYCLIILLSLLTLCGCKNDNGKSDTYALIAAGSPITIEGTIAYTDKAAAFTLSFNPSRDGAVSGTLSYDGATYELSGAYVAATGAINVSNAAANPHFVLSGVYVAGGEFAGTAVRTVGGSDETGSVSGLEQSAAASTQTYLGTFGSGASNTGLGTWNMTVSGSTFTGTFSDVFFAGKFVGTVSGSNLSVTTFYMYDSGQGLYVDIATLGINHTCTGSFSGSNVDGAWSWTGNGSGLFTGTLQP